MMLLADTNIIIDFWKNPTEETKKVFEEEDVCICGVVVAELLHGATSEKDMNAIKNAMSSFPRLHIKESDWEKIGGMLYDLRRSGLSIPFQDAIITFLAVENDVCVWTKDKHFKLIKEIIPDLKLFEA